MSFFKKNPLFCIVLVISILAFLVGAYLTFSESGKMKKAENRLTSAEAKLNTIVNADPAPTEENLSSAKENLSNLKEAIAEIREELQRGDPLETSEDGISVMAGVQEYISRLQRKAAEHTVEKGESEEEVPAPIETPQDFAFGFENYIDQASALEDPAKISFLDKQRQILNYLMNQLFDADPKSIQSVEREILEIPDEEGFKISPAVTAEVPGAIKTIAFRITFSGYTDSLREFLNSLSEFDLPIVVRSVEVTRPRSGQTVSRPQNVNNNNNEDIFGLFGESNTDGSQEDESVKVQEPVIEENVSRFTVTLEYIEVVLPDEPQKEVS